MLESSEKDHKCYIDTSGVTENHNLKIKYSCEDTQGLSGKNISSYEFVRMIDGVLKYESPNSNFEEFEGKLKLTTFPSSKPVTIDNFVCRGYFLVNTEKIYGLAVNVGNDCKCLY